MFGLGTWEILLILVAALVFIGPDKLPKVAKTIGKGMRQVRSAMSDVDHQVRRAGNDFLNAAEDDDEPAPEAPAEPAPPKAETEPPTPTQDDAPAMPTTNEEWLAHLRQPIEGRVAAAPAGRRKPHRTADVPGPEPTEGDGDTDAPAEADPS